MSAKIRIKCKNPHEFLISIIYSLSYASTVRGPVLHHSLLGLGYIFTALDIPSIYNMPAPDFLLINTQKKTVIAIECKGDTIEDSKLKSKFSEQVIDAIRAVVHDNEGRYKIEFVINTFDIYADHYLDIAREIGRDTSKNVLLWTTSTIPQVRADPSIGGSVEYYTLKKYMSPNYSIKHADEDLDKLLTQGILISENEIFCNSLVDPDASYQILFHGVSEYILLVALSDRYRGQKIRIMDFVDNIKRDYQSPVKRDRLRRVVIDILEVFLELGEVKTSSQEIVFKKRPRINVERFHEIRERIINMNDNEARRYVRELRMEKTMKKQ